MNTAERFFRRYILSTAGILILFLSVNLLLAVFCFVSAFFGGVADSSFPVEDLSAHITAENGVFRADAQAVELLRQADAWAMLLSENGDVLWEEQMPEELPAHFSVVDAALFSRWYLDDYPVNIWKRADGLLVIGLPPGKVVNYYLSFRASYVWTLILIPAAVLFINLFLVLFLFLRNTRRVERAMTPVLNGIQSLSAGKPVRLEEDGELAEINAGLNRAGAYLLKKDNTRAEWIRGISHDIRTPLSMILGYASEIEDTPGLSEAVKAQAAVIRRQSGRLGRLVSDLNLTTKLEYSLQPLNTQLIDPVELARQVVSEALNDGLPAQYDLELSEDKPGPVPAITGDPTLLTRMLSNLIQNSMVHNPSGCHIKAAVASDGGFCLFSVTDNGHGISEPFLCALNQDEDIASTQEAANGADHGLGLKIVRQIVKAHQGTITFADAPPHGLAVEIRLPLVEGR